ncbi:LytR/AlgR family response regulator transcription factor [Mucilaginibacter ginsenosidivorax]|uniref:Response regulator transcription factor n=1 Tax=Mucilaginibacter ginsenosidivorax TaxID=862126 RepID=A0A5B8W1S3_9SPHI|nr:LytTR family DNA-binding domain-containing protein [Mucilaginibacter ginsenosidivorax]QEC77663.1 response regulator transcription factor [Mucilaginibacter ginsenosidivorax]
MNLSCIIIDDEPDAVDLLELLIKQSTQWKLKAKCYNALEALAFLKTNQVDFIFLDINMPQLSGMELATLLPTRTRIVFTTAYSAYAAESYMFNTIDYLLKPITLKRFLSSVQKIEAYFAKYQPEQQPDAVQAQDLFFVKSGKTLRKIVLRDILYFEGEKDYVRLVTAREQLLVYRRLKDIEEQLNPPFIRVHNSYIINYEQLSKIEDNHIYIADKRIPVSEKFRDAFMDLINKKKF